MKVILLLIILVSLGAFAEDRLIQNKNLNSAINNSYGVRLDEQEEEIKKLTGKVELLEHKIHQIIQQLIVTHSNHREQEMETVSSTDVFDIATLEEISNTVKATELRDLDKKNITTDKQAYDLALAVFKDSKFAESEKEFAEFIQKYPNSNMIGNAYFWYGESFFKRKNFNSAAINYLKCYKQFPTGPKASDGLLKLALSLGELKKTQEACSILQKLDNEFPNRTTSSKKTAVDAGLKFGCKKVKIN